MPSDPIGDKPLYPSDNAWGIPTLRYASPHVAPDWIVPYRTRLPNRSTVRGAVHFFLYDALFESVWNAPNKSAQYLTRFTVLFSPDFSLYPEMPLSVQLYNVYRSRWCGAHWTANGYTVIPTVSWSSPESYAFCFEGIAPYSMVALTTLGTRRHKHDFLHGFDALVERVRPSRVLCYGTPFPEMERVPLQLYPNRWQETASDGG